MKRSTFASTKLPPPAIPITNPFFRQSFLILFQVTYLIAASLFVWIFFKGFAFLTISILILILSIWHPLGRRFAKDFIPFIILVHSFRKFLAPKVDLEHATIYITELINWERALFAGAIPSAVLQRLIPDTSVLYEPLKLIGNFFYVSHYAGFFLLAILLWHANRHRYWQFTWGLLLLTYAAIITMANFPAAPPWYATHFGYLTGADAVYNISQISAEEILDHYNPVAAMPSVHAAYAFYLAIFSTYVWGKKAWAAWLLPAGVCFATIFLGHHYVIDLIAGCLYATGGFLVTHWTYAYQLRLGTYLDQKLSYTLTFLNPLPYLKSKFTRT